MIRLKVLRWGDYHGLSGWTQCNHKDSYSKTAGMPQSEEVRVLKMLHLALKVKGHKAKKCRQPPEKGKENVFHLEPPEEMQP